MSPKLPAASKSREALPRAIFLRTKSGAAVGFPLHRAGQKSQYREPRYKPDFLKLVQLADTSIRACEAILATAGNEVLRQCWISTKAFNNVFLLQGQKCAMSVREVYEFQLRSVRLAELVSKMESRLLQSDS